jgi:hypothetical protein
MTSDELIIVLLESYSEMLARDDTPEAEKADAELEYDRLAWLIIATVNFASGRWAKKGFDNYQEHLENCCRNWAKVAPDQSKFVPSLNHESEGGRPMIALSIAGENASTPGAGDELVAVKITKSQTCSEKGFPLNWREYRDCHRAGGCKEQPRRRTTQTQSRQVVGL